MSYMVIPLTSDPNQTLTVTIPVDGNNLKLKLNISFNDVANYWEMTIYDPKTNVIILDNVPLLCGGFPAADLFEQYRYLGLGSAAIINVGNSSLDSPDATTLGSYFQLIWGDTAT